MTQSHATSSRGRNTKHRREVAKLQARLHDAEELIGALNRGEVDAIVRQTPAGEQIFTLEGAEHAYRVMVESMSEGALTVGADGLILYCNSCFAELVNDELQQVIGTPLDRFVAPHHRTSFGTLMRQARAGRARERIDLVRSDGKTVPTYVAMQLVAEAGRESIVTVVTELTAVQASEERYRRIVETINDGVVIVDEALTITFANPQFARMLLYPEVELLGRRVVDFIASADRRLFLAKVEWQQAELADRYELVWQRSDGTAQQTLTSVRPIFDRRRQYSGFTGVITDLTGLKRTELMRDQLARIVQGAQDAIFGIDRDGRIMSWNRGAQRIHGYSADEVIGRRAEILAPPDRRPQLATLISKVLDGEDVTGCETVRLTKTGAVVDVVLNMSPIQDATGLIVGVSTIAHDVTKMKRAAE